MTNGKAASIASYGAYIPKWQSLTNPGGRRTDNMKVATLSHEVRQQMLLRVRSAPECKAALEQLAGEVLEIRITGVTSYKLVFRDSNVYLDPSATPTIVAEGSVEVIDAMLSGQLDPLVAILTRRLKAKLDPARGPLLRTILRAGIKPEPNDMGWDRVIGKTLWEKEQLDD